MMPRPLFLPRRAALALLPVLAGCATTPVPPLAQPPRGRVLLLRGLLNVFSTGMTTLTLALRQAGFDATVHNHAEWRGLADRTATQARAGGVPRPLAVAGHSFGADDAIRLAGRLGAAGVPVDLLVTFDPSWVLAVPRGPRHVLNFHQDRDTYARIVAPGPGFDGRIENRQVNDESHLSIDKNADLHRQVLAAMEEVAMARPTGIAAPRAQPVVPGAATRAGAAPATPVAARVPPGTARQRAGLPVPPGTARQRAGLPVPPAPPVRGAR
jgi:thioesterase domain-containing protein